jgi:integrase
MEAKMPVQKRNPTDYPGVYFIISKPGTPKEDKIYYIDYRKDGKRIQEKAGFHSKGMTPAKANNKRSDRMRGREPTNAEKRALEAAEKAAKAGKWTIAKLWDSYCEIYTTNKGLKSEKRKFDLYLRDNLGEKTPSELIVLDVDRLRLRLQRKGKRTQAARILELLRRTVNFGVKRGLCPPLRFKIEIPRLNNQTTEDLTPKQLNELLKALEKDGDQITANIMRLALFTGMRRGEILKLKWSDIDTDKGFITLRDPKGGPDQKIPLSKAASNVFDNIETTKGNQHVFPGRFKNKPMAVLPRESVKRIKKAADLPNGFRPIHGLRHVYASMLASSGQVDMYTLQKLLTHKSPLMTQRYAHLRDEALKKASDVAANIIEQAAATEKDEKEYIVKITNKI